MIPENQTVCPAQCRAPHNMAEETHFGFSRMRLQDKQAHVDAVFHKVASRYDLMNDLMSGGLHRMWKDIFVSRVKPSRKIRFRHLDVAGGTGDIAFRVARAGSPLTEVVVLDINAAMLEEGRGAPAPPSAILPRRSTSSRQTPRSYPSPMTASMPIRSASAFATCRASTRRWWRRTGFFGEAASSSVSSFRMRACLSSTVFTKPIRFASSLVSAAWWGATISLIVISSNLSRGFPMPKVCAQYRRGGVRAGLIHAAFGRDRRNSFGLEALGLQVQRPWNFRIGSCGQSGRAGERSPEAKQAIAVRSFASRTLRGAIRFFRIGRCVRAGMSSSLGSLLRLTRAVFVLARAGVFSDIDLLIPPPAARLPLALARLLAKRGARSSGAKAASKKATGLANLPAAISRLGPSYVKLGHLGYLAGRRRRGRRSAARAFAGPYAAFSAHGCDRDHRGCLRRTARPHLYKFRRAENSPPPRPPRFTGRALKTAMATAKSPSRCCVRVSSGISTATSATCISRRAWPNAGLTTPAA